MPRTVCGEGQLSASKGVAAGLRGLRPEDQPGGQSGLENPAPGDSLQHLARSMLGR